MGDVSQADGFRGNPDEFGELGLAETGGLTQGNEASGLLGAGLTETTRHAGIVGVHLRILWICRENGLA